MRIVTWNVNGLRAAIRKGIDQYFSSLNADIILLQETRTLDEQLPANWSWPSGYHVHLHPAEKRGIRVLQHYQSNHLAFCKPE